MTIRSGRKPVADSGPLAPCLPYEKAIRSVWDMGGKWIMDKPWYPVETLLLQLLLVLYCFVLYI